MAQTAAQVPKKIAVRPTNKTAGGSSSASLNLGGRPSLLTPDTVRKLEEVFAIDGTVEEACFYAEISRDTYYRWIKENPALSDRFEALRQKPVLKARETIIKDLKNPAGAQWYLSRKRKSEFGGGIEEGQKTQGVNVYNFFFNEQAQEEVRAMEDKIKAALTQPRHVEPLQNTL